MLFITDYKEIRITPNEILAPRYLNFLAIAKDKGFPTTGTFLLEVDGSEVKRYSYWTDQITDEFVIRWEEY